MAFPTTLLPIVVELQIDGVWTDISTDVRYEQGIGISTGRSDEGTEVQPASCNLTLSNLDGKYSPRNPNSPYFGLIGRNTPIRVSVDEGDTYLNIADSSGDRASTPDAAALDITGNIDVRIEVRMDDPGTSSTTCLIGKYNTTGNQRSWRLLTLDSSLIFTWSTTGADFIEKTSTQLVAWPPSRRMALRVTLDVDNGAAGNTVTFYTAPTMDGPWDVLGDPVVTASTTSIFSSTATLDIGQIQNLSFLAPAGEILKAEVRSGIAGTAVANPDFTAQVSGDTSFADAAGRTWTIAGDATLTNRRMRFLGEVSEWPPRWESGGFDVTTSIQAAGLLRRLGQGAAELQSTLRRRIPSGDPLAYWPMEDGEAATEASSPIDGVPPLAVEDMTFGSNGTLGGSDLLPVLEDAGRMESLISGAASGGWHGEMVYNLNNLPTTETTMMRLYLSGAGSSVRSVRVRCSTAGIRVQALEEDGTVVAFVLFTTAQALLDFVGSWNRLQLFSYDDGPDCYVVAAWRDIANNTFWYADTVFTGAPGKVTRVTGGNWTTEFNGMALGHLSVFDTGGTSVTAPGVTIYNDADDGFAGESAINRMARVTEEQPAGGGVSFYAFDGDTTQASALVGGQGVGTFLEILREAEAVDAGILYEQLDVLRLVYRDRSGLYNQPVALALDYEGSDGLVTPLDPVDDDQNTRNDVTVTREDGSSGRAELLEGALSVLDPPNGVGRYEDSVTQNLYRDSQAQDHAGWLLNLGTVDEARYPQVSIKLQKTADTIAEVAGVGIGDRIQITNPPAWLPPDTIDLLVQGYTEYIDQFRWEITFNCTPALPYTVGVVEDEPLVDYPEHVDTDGSELAGAVTSTGTALPVTVTSGDVWIDGSLSYTGETATAFQTSDTNDYLVCTDADAADITVGDDVRIFTAAGDLKEATVFEITSKASGFGFTNCFFTPDAVTLPETSEQIRVATVTGSGAELPFDIRVGGEVMTVNAIASGSPITDTFTRTEASTWGTSDSGHAWTSTGGSAANFSVSSGEGKHSVASVNVSRYSVATADSADFDIQVTADSDALALGDTQRVYLVGRFVDVNNQYGARMDFTTAQAVNITLTKVVAGAGTAFTTVNTGLTHVANTQYRMRFQCVGSALKAKVWLAGTTEPSAWMTEVTDTSLTTAGSVGVRTLFLSGNTNTLPVVISFDDFASPQVFSVTRSVNTVVKAQTSGADVRLAHPAIVAL